MTIKNVTVSGLNGIPALDSDGLGCGQDYLGIYFHESSGSLNKDDVNGIDMPTDLWGCQGGQGIYVNSATSPAADNATVSMNKVSVATPLVTTETTAKLLAGTYNNDILAVTAVPAGWHSGEITVGGYELSATKDGHTAVFITGTTPAVVKKHATVIFYATTPAYNKNGITCDDVSTDCTITNATVQGGGPTNGIAQNGIQFFGNGSGSINSSTISDNNYTLGTPGNAASGILILDSGTVSVGNSAVNTVESNDVNIYAGEIQAYAPIFADGIPTAQTWTIGGQGNDIYNATQDGESVGANEYGEGIQLDGTTNPVDVFGNTISGSAQSAILLTGVENATIGGAGAGQSNFIGPSVGGAENFSGLVLAGPSTECETVGGGAPTAGCSYGGYPGYPTGPPDSPGWASYGNTVVDNMIESNLAGVVADGAFAPNYDGLTADPDGSYANSFSGNTWSGNFLANVADFSGQGSTYGNTIAPSAGNTGLNVANGYSGNSCNPYPGGSANVNSIAGLNGANYGTTVNQGTVTITSTTVTAPNPSINTSPPADTPGFTNVYAGEGILDTTGGSGVVPAPDHVTAVASPTSLTISDAATASTTGQTNADTNDLLSFGQDWAC